MSHPAQVLFNEFVPKLLRNSLNWGLGERSIRVESSMLPIPKSATASIAATQLQAMTVPSGSTIGPFQRLAQVSLRLLTDLSFMAGGSASRLIRPLADVYDQVKSNCGR